MLASILIQEENLGPPDDCKSALALYPRVISHSAKMNSHVQSTLKSNRNTCGVVLKLESISVITNTMKVVVTNEWMDGYK